VARYFLLEADSGVTPTQTADSAEEPFDLPIDFASGAVAWVEDDGQRGLRWSYPGAIGGPLRPIADSKFEMLDTRSEVTIEVVASVENVASQTSRLFHIGSGQGAGDLSLRSDDPGELNLAFNNQQVGVWSVELPTLGRAVVHLVVESGAGTANDRARLYVNGALVDPEGEIGLAMNAAIALSSAPYLALGNREGNRSIQGVVYYAAMYGVALDLEEVEHNATLLFEDDDSAG
jgi:hypothetical protein